MIIQDRWYQIEAADAVIEDILFSDKKINPVIVAPPGSGKSVIPCRIIDEYLTKFPDKGVLILQDEENILEQNHKKLSTYFEHTKIGMYNATIGVREIQKITCASIQSIYKKPELFADRNIGLIIIDECHKSAIEKKGMYRKFLNKINEKALIVGMTATPWKGRRLITEGKDALFNKITYNMLEYKKYNSLVDDGYLVPLIPLPTDYQLDDEGIDIVGDDFDERQMSNKFDLPEITSKIVEKICKYGKKKYKKWLIFAIDSKHAEHISKEINDRGFPCEAVYTGSARSKVEVLGDFKRGDLRAVVNVGMLTTGVDVPEIDLIAFARLTNSPVWHVQTNGRGSRPVYADGFDLTTKEGRLAAIKASGKTHCLILDFGRNTKRLGPINGIELNEKEKKKKGIKRIMAKSCKNCDADNHLRATECIACGEEFQFEIKLQTTPGSEKILKDDKPAVVKKEKRWLKVIKITYEYFDHHKPESGISLKVEYHCMLMKVNQFVMIEHKKNWPRQQAKAWIRNRYTGKEKIENALQLWNERALMKMPTHICVEQNGDYLNVVDLKFENGDNLDAGLLAQYANEKNTKKIAQNFVNKMKQNSVSLPSSFGDWDDDIPF